MNEFIICQYLDYIHISDVEEIRGDQVILKSNKNWERIIPRNKIQYQSTHSTSDSGPKKVENVNVECFQSSAMGLLNNKEYYILRLYSENNNFLVGSLEYPAVKSLTNSKTETKITFKSESPVI